MRCTVLCADQMAPCIHPGHGETASLLKCRLPQGRPRTFRCLTSSTELKDSGNALCKPIDG